MKKQLLLLILFVAALTACESEEEIPDPIEIPPVESFVMNFDDFKVENNKSKLALNETYVNWTYSFFNVAIWNTILTLNMAVPVAAFANSFNYEPEYLGDFTWQWSYTVPGFTSEYSARMTGTLGDTNIKWEMYISKTGIGAFDEFMWFEGSSAIDGNSGNWSINTDYLTPTPYLIINWTKSGEQIGTIKYTYTHAGENNDINLMDGSFVQMSLQEGNYDAAYNILYSDTLATEFIDINIEWDRETYFGRVKSPAFYLDENWHCWDHTGADTDC